MATKSIVKTVKIEDDETARNFINAFEISKRTPQKEIKYTNKCTEITGDKIKAFFDV